MPINTAFTPNPDKLAQFTGDGSPIIAIAPIYAAAVNLSAQMMSCSYIQILGVSATSAACAVTTTFLPTKGNPNVQVYCQASGGTVTFTFGAGFKTSATVAPTIGTAITVEFCWNGTNWVEAGRSVAVTF